MSNPNLNELHKLMQEAQSSDSCDSVKAINGKKIYCMSVAQTRNGRRIESFRFRMDGERSSIKQVMSALS